MKQETRNLAYLLLTLYTLSLIAIAVILFAAVNCHADTVIVIPDGNNNSGIPSRYDQMNSIIQNHNWNIERNAAVLDALKYDNLKPPTQNQIQIQRLDPLPVPGAFVLPPQKPDSPTNQVKWPFKP